MDHLFPYCPLKVPKLFEHLITKIKAENVTDKTSGMKNILPSCLVFTPNTDTVFCYQIPLRNFTMIEPIEIHTAVF
jgi:hypothetical protein